MVEGIYIIYIGPAVDDKEICLLPFSNRGKSWDSFMY